VAVDLFCGGGGCSMGLWQAGFQPVGFDASIHALKHYPFPHKLLDLTADNALHEIIATLRRLRLSSRPRIVIASPPCQGYSVTRFLTDPDTPHPNLIKLARYLAVALTSGSGAARICSAGRHTLSPARSTTPTF
jgi:site-specific DNA-cytosine methylase